jgi:hypothetical protein
MESTDSHGRALFYLPEAFAKPRVPRRVQANEWYLHLPACLQCASNDRKRLLEIISEMRRQSFGREQLQGFEKSWKIFIIFYYCVFACVKTAMAFGVLAILGPERSQSPEVAKLLGSKVS